MNANVAVGCVNRQMLSRMVAVTDLLTDNMSDVVSSAGSDENNRLMQLKYTQITF